MLILSRFKEQEILIGDDIRIKITDIKVYQNQLMVSLGIEAPRHIRILRPDAKVKEVKNGHK